jgi:hypothetical protein
MNRPRSPPGLLTAILAGWVNRHQRGVIDDLLEENQILRAKLGEARLQFSDAERRRFARKGGPLGRWILEAISQIVTPDTILALAQEARRREVDLQERPAPKKDRRAAGDQGARRPFHDGEPHWGYDKIQGALLNLGYDVAASTIKAILKRHGIEPSPERRRRTPWKCARPGKRERTGPSPSMSSVFQMAGEGFEPTTSGS